MPTGKYTRTKEHLEIMKRCQLGKTKEHIAAIAKTHIKYPGNSKLDRHLRVRYNGFTEEEYIQMFKKQDGVCKICGKPEKATIKGTLKRLSVDHDHTTNKVRGLLCDNCNRAIGLLKDNAYTAYKLVQYLEEGI